MEKELEKASEVVTGDVSGFFYNLKAAVYNFLGKLFSWLSTHQGLALIIVIVLLLIMIWFILKIKKSNKQLEKKVSSKNVEIGKKDALIEEQKNNLEVLQNKLSDREKIVSEALLKTMMSLTGYDIDQLQSFFKSLAGISRNPLQIAATQTNTMTKRQRIEKESHDPAEENNTKEEMAAGDGPEKAVETNKSGTKEPLSQAAAGPGDLQEQGEGRRR